MRMQGWKKKNFYRIKKYEKKGITNKKKLFLKISWLFLIFYITKLEHNINNKLNVSQIINNKLNVFQIINNKLKVCVCTLGRNENLYIREFVSHYEKYGVDKIFLYDNNKKDGERFEDVIGDYINNSFVELLDWRGKDQPIFPIMNDCYRKNNNKYDWLIFYEIDEFINLYNFSNVKDYLNQDIFKNCSIIHLNIINHSDNNKLYYENKSLHERFPVIVPLERSQISVKSIVRGNISNLQISWMHYINENIPGCNGFGGPSDLIHGNDFKYYVIDHYYSKSTEEFIRKITRGDCWRGTFDYIQHRTEKYLNQNHITLEKIGMLEKGIGINLSKYKKYIIKRIRRRRNIRN